MQKFQTALSKTTHQLNKNLEISLDKLLIVIPAYNESEAIIKTVNDIKANTNFNYIVINDGSSDDTKEVLEANKINHISHSKNRGLSEAIRTGMQYALNNNYLYIVQFDGDGQHSAKDVQKMLNTAARGFDIVCGSRYLNDETSDPSSLKKTAHNILQTLFYLRAHQKISDPTCGIRLYNWIVMEAFLRNSYLEVEPSTIAFLIRKGMKIAEVPVFVKDRENGESMFTSHKIITKYMFSQCWKMSFSSKFWRFR